MNPRIIPLFLGLLMPAWAIAQRLTPEQKAHRAAIQQSLQGRKTVISQDTIFHIGVPMGILRSVQGAAATYKISAINGETVVMITAHTLATATTSAYMRYQFFVPQETEARLPYQYGESAEAIADRLIAWDVLTPQGWNAQGISRFVTAHPEHSPEKNTALVAKSIVPPVQSYSPIVARDRNAALYLSGKEIFQGGFLIGKYESLPLQNEAQPATQLTISYTNGKNCAIATYPLGGTQATIITLHNQQQTTIALERFGERESIVKFLIEKGVL